MIAAGALGLLVLGARPFELEFDDAGELIATALALALALGVVAICLAKRRVVHAVVGLWVLPLAIYAASRLGKPRSPWARRFYGERNPRKQAKAERRFAAGRRTDRFKEAFRDAVGGATEQEYEAKLTERQAEAAEEAATLEAAEEVRRRAESQGAKPGRRGPR